MLEIIGTILFIVWLVAMLSGHTLGGVVHVLLVVVIAVFVARIIKGS